MTLQLDDHRVSDSMDTSPMQNLPPSLPGFALSPHDTSLSPDPVSLLHSDMNAVFSDESGVSSDLVASLQVAVPVSPVGMAMSMMDDSVTPVRAPAPGFIPDFPSHSFDMRVDSTMSSAGITSPGDSSSAIHAPTPAFSVGTSSLASALDSSASSQSRSDASSSPANLANSSGYSSASSVPPPLQESGFAFPPTDLKDSVKGSKETSSTPPEDAHFRAMDSILAGVINNAHSAREACNLGQTAEANVKINEMKRLADLIQGLMAATQLADNTPISQRSSPRHQSSSGSSASPPSSTNIARDQHPGSLGRFPAPPTVKTDVNVMSDIQTSSEALGESRKRCASIEGDRVMKAPKMEPQDDIILSTPQSDRNLSLVQSLSVYPSLASAGTVVSPFTQSTPPSDSSSRPQSSAGLSSLPSFGAIPASLSYPALITLHEAAPTLFEQTSPVLPTSSFSTPPSLRSSWSESPLNYPTRQHQHTSSGSSLNGLNIGGIGPMAAGIPPFTSPGTFSSPPQVRPAASTSISPPIGRLSRSGSLSGPPNPFAFSFPEVSSLESITQPPQLSRPSTSVSTPEETSDDEDDYDRDSSPPSRRGHNGTYGSHSNRSPAGHGPNNHGLDNVGDRSGGHGNEVPQEYRAEVDRIFFEFLNKTCSNLNATDAKNEPIHQTLMAKKMQRLDESPDFRPFKFRIQAFTNAFLEELAHHGYPEEKIPMKKIRNYLWSQPYISRFNEDGKKAKSKGNHIWNIDAKKTPDGGWVFRPFQRRLAGSPPGVAYIGLRWSWVPRVWDPWGARPSGPIVYHCPNMPSWLSWKDDVLSGTPPPDAESCDITVEAKFLQDGLEERLSQTFHLNVAPTSTLDNTFPTSRRSSINGDLHNPRRVQSDPIIPQSGATSRSLLRGVPSKENLQPTIAPQDAQVMQVLTTAAQRVAQEAQSQVIASPRNEPVPGLQALAKQQHVLTLTAQAFDQEVTGQRPEGTTQQSNILAVAAQQVVFQAARQVVADRSAAAAISISVGFSPAPPPPSQITVNEVSVATQTAVAQAVEITGPLSSEVDVLMTASSLLEQQARAPTASVPHAHLIPRT